MTDESDPVAELKRLMCEARLCGHKFEDVLAHFVTVFDTMADNIHLNAPARICICLAKAHQLAEEAGDEEMLALLEQMLRPILPILPILPDEPGRD